MEQLAVYRREGVLFPEKTPFVDLFIDDYFIKILLEFLQGGFQGFQREEVLVP